MKTKHFILPAFLILIFFEACKNNDPPYYQLYPETREWDCYKRHSWWVYKNEATGVLDSVWVKERDETVEIFDHGTPCTYDNIQIDLKSSDNVTTYLLNLRGGSEGSIITLGCLNINTDILKEYYVTLLKFTPQIENSFLLDSKTNVVENLDIFYLNNNEFTNVIHITCEIFNYDGRNFFNQGYHATDEFWISRHEGIIKKIIRNPIDTAVWTLQRFKIYN